MDIRLITIDDYEELYRLWKNTPGMGLNDIDDSRAGVEKYLKRNPHTCFAAVEGGRIVGAIMSGHDGRRGYISHTAVIQDMRRRGIGSALTEAALNALAGEGICKVALVAFARNETGNRFWEQQGFEERGDLTYRNRALREIRREDT